MSGQPKSRTIKNQIEEFVNDLEAYMRQEGVPESLPRPINHYINIPRSELMNLSTKDLEEMQYEIYLYTYHLQSVVNRQLAKANKCKAEIDNIIGPVLSNYSHIYSWEQKRLVAIMDDDAARQWSKYEVQIRAAVTRTEFLVQRLENVARCLDNIAKRRQNA